MVGAMGAFVGIGALHDVGASFLRLAEEGRLDVAPRFTVVFVAFGMIYIAWEATGRATRALARCTPRRAEPALAAMSWLLSLQVVCILLWLTVPVLRGGALPSALERRARAALVKPVPVAGARRASRW
jgi:hypothetical protein